MHALATFVIWLILLVLFSRVLDRLLSQIFPQGRYRWVIWPGIVVHELSHAIVAKLMLARITNISLFSKTGGSVTHTRAKVPVIGSPIISMAPLFGCIAAIAALAYAFGFDERLIMTDPSAATYFSNIGLFFRENFASWRFWLFLYLMLATATAIAPSNQDFKNSWWGIVLILVALGALVYFGVAASFLGNVLGAAGSLFALGVLFELMVLIPILPLWLWRRRKRT